MNPQLTPEQRSNLFSPLFSEVQNRLQEIAKGDEKLFWALRRKLTKELQYLERGKPTQRKRLKEIKRKSQNNLCAICGKILPGQGAELDRHVAHKGYNESNTRLVHHECHIADQVKKKFK